MCAEFDFTSLPYSYVHAVLKAILAEGGLYDQYVLPADGVIDIKITDPESRFKFFNGCVGALDGTHIPAVIPADRQV
jgi:hypothetical protein